MKTKQPNLATLLKQRSGRTNDDIVKAIRKSCFPKQLEFIDDRHRKKAACCTRRAAKTYSVGVQMMTMCLERPDTRCLFLSQTNQKARRDFFDNVLMELVHNFHLDKLEQRSVPLRLNFPNGSYISVMGADTNKKDIEKLRGSPWDVVALDEVQSWEQDVQYLVNDVVNHCVHQRKGQIVMTGTPGLVKDTYWHKVTDGRIKGWNRHAWSWRDNTSPERMDGTERVCDNYQIAYDKDCEDDPLGGLSPRIQREFDGLWVVGEDEKVYAGTDRFDHIVAMPKDKGDKVTIIGGDMGWNDSDAIVVGSYFTQDPTLYVHQVFKQNRLDILEFGDILHDFAQREKPNAIVIDAHNAKSIATLERRYQLRLLGADHLGKVDHIRLLNAELQRGRVVLLPMVGCAGDKLCVSNACPRHAIRREWDNIVWNQDIREQQGKLVIMPGSEDHLSDALLYMYMQARHYTAGIKVSAARKELSEVPTDPFLAEGVRHEAAREVQRQAQIAREVAGLEQQFDIWANRDPWSDGW